MKKLLIILALAGVAAAVFYFAIYEKPGPLEKLGREVDETLDKVRYGDESTMEKAGRKIGEAADDVKQEFNDD
jgi:hypothetical protein